mmetsp:Transcript_22951/g.53380  ORF Transcript_22951/g.53380 Transcript_22951/m.53380 type:complete len:360 (-) Transcript_22951:212-1291(-)
MTPTTVPSTLLLTDVLMTNSIFSPPSVLNIVIFVFLTSTPCIVVLSAVITSSTLSGASNVARLLPVTASLVIPVMRAAVMFHWITVIFGSTVMMAAFTLSMTCPSSLTTASFSPLVCIRSSFSRTRTLLLTSSAWADSSMSCTSMASPCATLTSHRSHGVQVPLTESMKVSKLTRGRRSSPSLTTHLVGSPPHLMVVLNSGRNHSSSRLSTLMQSTPVVVLMPSNEGKYFDRLVHDQGSAAASFSVFLRRRAINSPILSESGTTPTGEKTSVPCTHPAPLTPGMRSMRFGLLLTRPRRRRPGFCPCWYMWSHREAWSWRHLSCLRWFSASSRLLSLMDSAWARKSHAILAWYETNLSAL